ncbi:MAG: hypothetical protein K2K14_03415 [Ruminococcus sp.]|nr:hypothetical protein [Ruminococcus sp.]
MENEKSNISETNNCLKIIVISMLLDIFTKVMALIFRNEYVNMMFGKVLIGVIVTILCTFGFIYIRRKTPDKKNLLIALASMTGYIIANFNEVWYVTCIGIFKTFKKLFHVELNNSVIFIINLLVNFILLILFLMRFTKSDLKYRTLSKILYSFIFLCLALSFVSDDMNGYYRLIPFMIFSTFVLWICKMKDNEIESIQESQFVKHKK